jgi:hypothetical protein
LHSVAHFAKYRDGLSITPQATSQDIMNLRERGDLLAGSRTIIGMQIPSAGIDLGNNPFTP